MTTSEQIEAEALLNVRGTYFPVPGIVLMNYVLKIV